MLVFTWILEILISYLERANVDIGDVNFYHILTFFETNNKPRRFEDELHNDSGFNIGNCWSIATNVAREDGPGIDYLGSFFCRLLWNFLPQRAFHSLATLWLLRSFCCNTLGNHILHRRVIQVWHSLRR